MLRFNRISSRLLLLLAASTARLLERTVKANLQLQELLTEIPGIAVFLAPWRVFSSSGGSFPFSS
jgi:hypothetical protein